MNYHRLLIVSIIAFVFLSLTTVVILSQNSTREVGTPSCEIYQEGSGTRCARIRCDATGYGRVPARGSNPGCDPTHPSDQSELHCESRGGPNCQISTPISCNTDDRGADFGRSCDLGDDIIRIYTVESRRITCPVTCPGCPNSVGTKPCRRAVWDTTYCKWDPSPCRIGGNPTYECDPYCQGQVLTEDDKSDDNTSNAVDSCCILTPIVVDIDGDGFELTSAANGVIFDFNGDGVPHRMSWTKENSDEAWLVLDRNANGTIDDGSELFGNMTPQPQVGEKHGFLALAEYDKLENGGNEDGKINKLDTIFTDLRLWQDKNHNGISESSELKKLRRLDVKAFKLDYRTSNRTDRHGNAFRYKAKVKDTRDGNVGKWAWDVFLVLDEEEDNNSQDRDDYDLTNVEIYR